MKLIRSVDKPSANEQLAIVIDAKAFKKSPLLDADQNNAVSEAVKANKQHLYFSSGKMHIMVVMMYEKPGWLQSEKLRRKGAEIVLFLNDHRKESVCILAPDKHSGMALAEGMALSNYQFLKYRSDKKKAGNTLKSISIGNGLVKEWEAEFLNVIVESTYLARDLVNEPQNSLNSVQIAEEFKKVGKQSGFTVEVWNEAKITAQKMGGILAVNRGSKIPPTFTIMEHKPKGAINKKPYVLVGKGVVYDTGGLSLKPTPMSMDHMKCDMAGSAVVVAVLSAAAKLEMPLHIIGLVPATDNWIGENSYAPGDIITMYSGTTVEVMNTDAEGRLVLADALHFAKKLKPGLVCDFATLTGAAVRAIGPYASAMLGQAEDEVKSEIFESAYAVFERLVEFPLWQEYADELKSDIADMTNLGKGEGGQISAAKFLEHFTDYPWLHFDIAGPAFNHANDSYRPKGGTGTGVRMMIDFFNKQCLKNKKSKK